MLKKIVTHDTGSKYFMDNLTVNINCAAPGCKSYVIGWRAGPDSGCHFPSNVVAMAAGYEHCLFLKEDSAVAACGSYYPGDVLITIPDGLTNMLAVSGGDAHSLALKSDGSVVA